MMPRVSFNRISFTVLPMEGDNVRLKENDLGSMTGFIVGVVVKPYRDIFRHTDNHVMVGAEITKTFAVVCCDDGKVEEVALEFLTFLGVESKESRNDKA